MNRQAPLVTLILVFTVLLLTACGDSESEKDSAENKTYTVGIVQLVPLVFDDYVAGFKEKLTEDGFVEGENISYIAASTAEELDEKTNIKELDLITIVPSGSGSQLGILLDLTDESVPIIVGMSHLEELLEGGFINDPARPGKQITGVNVTESDERRFEIFVEMLPEDSDRILVTFNLGQVDIDPVLARINSIATDHDLEIVSVETSTANLSELPETAEELDEGIDAIFMVQLNFGASFWFDLAKERLLPVSFYGDPVTIPEWFGVMGYGPIMHNTGQQAGNQAQQILHGTKPGDLPIEDTDAFLTIDLGVADAIGLEISDEILNRASVIHRTEVVFETDDEPADELVAEAGTGACMTSMTSPGGTNSTCVTTTCDSLPVSGFITYNDRVDVAACPAESLVGICAAEAFDTYFYDGAASTLQTGCGFMSGSWTSSAE